MYLYDNVVKWDDFAVKETFDNAKMRYWARINGIPCNLVLPDPDIYIDNVDWNATIDPELIMDLEKEEVRGFNEEQEDAEIVIVDGKLFRNQQYVPPTGWGDDEFKEPKPFDPTFGAQGWGSPLQQDGAPLEHAKEYDVIDHARTYEWHDWRNDSWGWNRREHYGGDRDGNWGTTSWDGYNRKRENMSWSRTPHAYNGNNKYHHMNRRGRNYRGGRGRGNFVYVPKEMPSRGD